MFQYFHRTKMFIPHAVHRTVFDVDFGLLQSQGYYTILFDLDNTLGSYDDPVPSAEIIKLFQELTEQGFKLYVISNNSMKRVAKFCASLPVLEMIAPAFKPLAGKTWRFMKRNKLDPQTTIFVGDQLMTDMLVANKLGLYAILVKAIALRQERWYTNYNRRQEAKVIKKIAKLNPEIAQAIIKETRDV